MITLAILGVSCPRSALLAIAALLAGSMSATSSAGAAAPGASAAPSTTSPPSSSADITYKVTKLPEYPVTAMEREEQGLVLLDVTVDSSGKVLKVDVDPRGTNAADDLQAAAAAAVKAWQFNPGMKNGLPVGGIVVVPVNFGIANTCSAGYLPVGRAVSGYSCVPTTSQVPDKPGQCLHGFTYHQGRQKTYSCIPNAVAASASAPTSAP